MSQTHDQPIPGFLKSLSAAEERTLDENGVPVRLDRQFRRATAKSEGYNADDHTVELTLTSEEPVERYYGTEILSHKKGAIRETRLKNGISLLFNHNYDAHLGRSIGYDTPDGGPLKVKYRFGPSPLAVEKETDVAAGVLVDTSGGYQVYEWEITEDKKGVRTYLAVDWEPLEGSLVTVPADPKVGVGRAAVKYTLRKLGEEGEVVQSRKFVFDPGTGASTRMADDTDVDPANVPDVIVENPDSNERSAEAPVDPAPEPVSAPPITTHPTEQRTAPMPPEVTTTVDNAAQETARRDALKVLHTQYPNEFNARSLEAAIALEMPLERVKAQIGEAIISSSQRHEVPTVGDEVFDDMPESDKKRYSIVRALRFAINQRFKGTFTEDAEAGLENEVSNEIGKRLQKIGAPAGFGGGLKMPNNLRVNIGAASRMAQRLGQAGAFVRALTAGGNMGSTAINTVTEATIIDLLRNRVRCLQLGCGMVSGVQGLFRIPRQTAAASSSWLAEAGTGTNSDATLDDITASPHRLNVFGSYTIELLAQSVVAVEDFVRADQVAVKARSMDYAGIAGSGTGNVPLGLLNIGGLAAVISGSTRSGNTVTAGTGAVPLTYVDVNAMEAAPAASNADEEDMGWMLTPQVRAAMRSTPKFPSGISDPIWPSDNSRDPNGLQTGPLGYKAGITNQLPKNLSYNPGSGSVSGLHAAIFGYWPNLIFVDWGVSELVLDNITLAASGKYQVIENSLHDVMVRHIESFVACSTILPD